MIMVAKLNFNIQVSCYPYLLLLYHTSLQFYTHNEIHRPILLNFEDLHTCFATRLSEKRRAKS